MARPSGNLLARCGLALLVALAACTTSSTHAPPVSFGATPPSIVVFGDSQTAGTWLPEPALQSWPALLGTRVCPAHDCVENRATGGQPLMLTSTAHTPIEVEAPDSIDPADPPDVVIVMAGQVDLVSSDDVVAIGDAYVRLDAQLRAEGVGQVVFVTLLPYDPTTYSNPEWLPVIEPRRAAINDRLRQDWAAKGQLYDIEPVVTAPGTHDLRPDYANKDGNHPSITGAAAIADNFPLALLTSSR